jgi:hypothetical protein
MRDTSIRITVQTLGPDNSIIAESAGEANPIKKLANVEA